MTEEEIHEKARKEYRRSLGVLELGYDTPDMGRMSVFFEDQGTPPQMAANLRRLADTYSPAEHVEQTDPTIMRTNL